MRTCDESEQQRGAGEIRTARLGSRARRHPRDPEHKRHETDDDAADDEELRDALQPHPNTCRTDQKGVALESGLWVRVPV